MGKKRQTDELKSDRIPLWDIRDKQGFIVLVVKRERIFDTEATVPAQRVSLHHQKRQKIQGVLLETRFRFHIEKYFLVEERPRFDDTLIEVGWVKTDLLPILPWITIVGAMELYPDVKDNLTHISNELIELQDEFIKLA